jgi:2-oxoglutarate ferredoxin oxidoreductase subunit alpha
MKNYGATMSETPTNNATEPGREIINDVIIRFAGDGGEGVITSGEFVATAASRMGLEILKVTSLPAEIKGGPAMIQVRLGQKLPQSQGSLVDMLVCFNDEVYHLHKGDLKPNGILLYDTECNIDDTNAEALKIEVPFGELAKKEAGGKLAKNMVVMGSVGALLGIAFEEFEKLAHAKFDRKGEKVVEANLNGLRIGY